MKVDLTHVPPFIYIASFSLFFLSSKESKPVYNLPQHFHLQRFFSVSRRQIHNATMKIPTASALFIPLTSLLIYSPTPVCAGPIVASGCAAVCVTASLGCHGVGHSTLSLFSGGLLAAPTFLACHAVLQTCLGGCAVVTIAPTF